MANGNSERPATAEHAGPALTNRLRQWRADLAAFEIPAVIRTKCGPSSVKVARRLPDEPLVPIVPKGSRSFEREWEALDGSGSVIDIGAGTGDASLVLAARMSRLTAVDPNADQLEALERRARGVGVATRNSPGPLAGRSPPGRAC